jgi:hypothetical protein
VADTRSGGRLFRAVDTQGIPVYFGTEEAMREQGPRVARYRGSNLTLQSSIEHPLTAQDQWVDIGSVEWDGQDPEDNPTKLLECTFTGRVVALVRLYDHNGVARDLAASMRGALNDVLAYELSYDEPEDSDLIQAVTESDVTGFAVISITDTSHNPEKDA